MPLCSVICVQLGIYVNCYYHFLLVPLVLQTCTLIRRTTAWRESMRSRQWEHVQVSSKLSNSRCSAEGKQKLILQPNLVPGPTCKPAASCRPAWGCNSLHWTCREEGLWGTSVGDQHKDHVVGLLIGWGNVRVRKQCSVPQMPITCTQHPCTHVTRANRFCHFEDVNSSGR